jgi:uncharacterized protein YegJ (DUF2314 family)
MAAAETAKTIASIVMIGLVLPVVLLKARDRGYLKTTFGVLAVLVGLGILAALYNHFGPGRGNPWDMSGSVGIGLAILLFILGARWIRNGGPGIEHVPPGFQCEELKASVAQARAALPWFVEQVDKNVDGAFIKFPLRTPGGNTEHIWAYVHSFRNRAFNVSLANFPYDVEQNPDGRRDVPQEEVEDWQILQPDGKIKGAYSLIALFKHFESKGKLNRRRLEQKAQLIDA